MRIILDTHTLMWWWAEPARLSKKAASILRDSKNVVLVSAACAWEIAIKVNLKKIDDVGLAVDFVQHILEDGFTELPISALQAIKAGLLPLHHKDPVDRVLVAQAQDLNIPILSADRLLDEYDVVRVW